MLKPVHITTNITLNTFSTHFTMFLMVETSHAHYFLTHFTTECTSAQWIDGGQPSSADNDRHHAVFVKVNKNFAIKLVAEEPVTHVEARVVSCDGGGGALGHPKVYINLVRACTQ